ncbi:hypothetical protein FVE85_1994 [Porphyridium purpureum]|uniref:Uncharacterized protein n=1 Tax=Porphyridium purpureum TaxID=35688 RepID=A0A5J4YWB1_PORPP|nr:hypothetical protein FVE85_1994 [Porphyridium purpureum]|eukprot:POR7004..scf209_3
MNQSQARGGKARAGPEFPKGISVHDVDGVVLLECRPDDLKGDGSQTQVQGSGAPEEEEEEEQQQRKSSNEMPVSIINCEMRPLFFIADLFHQASCWVTVMLFFASRGVRCFAMSFSKSRQSLQRSGLNPARRTVDDCTMDIDTCVRFMIFSQRLHEPVLVGHGLGASLLLKYVYFAQNEISFPMIVVLSPVLPSWSWAYSKAIALMRNSQCSIISALSALWSTFRASSPLYSPEVYRALALRCPKDEEAYNDDIVSQIWEHEVRNITEPWQVVIKLLSAGLGYESGTPIIPEIVALRPEQDVFCSAYDGAAFADFHGCRAPAILSNAAHDIMLGSNVAALCEVLLNTVVSKIELRDKTRREMERMLAENQRARE